MSYPEARYRGDKGEISAIYRPADQKPELAIGLGTAVRYLATGASTNGEFGLYRWDARPHTPGPNAHFHRTMSESFFILSGTVRLFNGERMTTQTKKTTQKGKNTTSSIVWFEIPADNPERAKKFYSSLFGWKIEKFPGVTDYWHIDTGGADRTRDGGLIARKHPEEPITNYINVSSVDESAAKVEKLGGKIHKPKTAVPQMGYFVICQDTENNTFALWESNDRAK